MAREPASLPLKKVSCSSGASAETDAAALIPGDGRADRAASPPDPDSGEKRRDDARQQHNERDQDLPVGERDFVVARLVRFTRFHYFLRFRSARPLPGRYLFCAELGKNDFIISIGSGKMIVEFFSAAISVSVWR